MASLAEPSTPTPALHPQPPLGGRTPQENHWLWGGWMWPHPSHGMRLSLILPPPSLVSPWAERGQHGSPAQSLTRDLAPRAGRAAIFLVQLSGGTHRAAAPALCSFGEATKRKGFWQAVVF